MGLFFSDVIFEQIAPSPSEIVEKMSAVSGLDVEFQLQEGESEYFKWRGTIAFSRYPKETMEISCCDPEHSPWVRWPPHPGQMAFISETPPDNPLIGPMEKLVPTGRENIHIRGSIGLEPTLLKVFQFVLVLFGGKRSKRDGTTAELLTDEEKNIYGAPIDLKAWQKTRRKHLFKVVLPLVVGSWLYFLLFSPLFAIPLLISLLRKMLSRSSKK